ncbi:SRPBCC family protein [Streptomyces silvensis]|uniref:Immediate-early protein 2 n=1 Tax=Streptomyces silvensis TaxID=1765722 RepID=A0A0W7X7S4_9ACTN|nr:SRPBCC family protein [Streptomyces silvensis]KUF19004.1 Immediate-early protein 2 [Streptomyces silvensis]
MAFFRVERVTPLSPAEAWRRLTDWERHGQVVPLTEVTVSGSPPYGEGTVFTPRSGIGRFAFDDPMEVVVWRPPRAERSGLCRLVKHGSVVTGWAEIEVHARGRGSRVVWREELRVRGVPRFADPVVARVASRMFGRAATALLAGGRRPAEGSPS